MKTSVALKMVVTGEEAVMIVALRKDPMLRKAVMDYFQTMAGIDIEASVEKLKELKRKKQAKQEK